jgi:Phage integrase, N-terminal SAM-like domain
MGYGAAMTPDYRPNLVRSFERHLRAENRSEHTIASYLESLRQAEAFLAGRGRSLVDARREDLEAFLGELLQRGAPETVATRYRRLGSCTDGWRRKRRSPSIRWPGCGRPSCPSSPSPSFRRTASGGCWQPALARSWRPTEVWPGARHLGGGSQAVQEALSGLQGQLAIEPPPDGPAELPDDPAPPVAPPAGYRLRLAVAAAARDGDQAATAALVREGSGHGVDAAELIAVAEQHWPKPALHRRAWRAGRRWTAARAARRHRPRRSSAPGIPWEGRP